MNEKTIGYARTACHVQGDEHAIDAQVERLKAAGCSVVFTDRGASGSSLGRPGLREARANLQSGDKLKVVRIDRIARSASAVVTFVTDLNRNGIELEALDGTDAEAAIRLQDDLNYGRVLTPKTPWLRKLAYRAGRFLIRISGRGEVPRL